MHMSFQTHIPNCINILCEAAFKVSLFVHLEYEIEWKPKNNSEMFQRVAMQVKIEDSMQSSMIVSRQHALVTIRIRKAIKHSNEDDEYSILRQFRD